MPYVAALLIQRPEVFHVGIFAVNAIADRNHHASEFVVRIVKMRVHHELARARVDKHFGSLQNPVRTQMLRVCERQHLAPKLPVREIVRRIAGNVALLGIVGRRAVLTEPVVRALPDRDAPTVRLNALATGVKPRFAGPDNALRGAQPSGHQRQ